MMTNVQTEELMTETVSTPDAAREAGLTYRQIWYWIAMKAIRPMYGNGGSGNPYRFTPSQVDHLRQIGALYRLMERDVGGAPATEFIRRVWDSLEATGTFNLEDGPVVITLPWPPDVLPEGA